MKSMRKSIGSKISLLYLFLAIINMSFFSIIIYENQIDLITENTKYGIMDLTNSLISALNRFGSEMDSPSGRKKKRSEVIKEISGIIGRITSSYVIFSEDGKQIFSSDSSIKISRTDVISGIKAVTNKDFTGKPFYSVIDEKKYQISFYIPFSIRTLRESILFLNFSMKDIDTRLTQLYRLITLILIMISIFHLFFAILLFRMFVRPIKALHEKSVAISRGDLSARSKIKQNDEIGELSQAFNSMADAVQEKINTLQVQHEKMEDELDMASKVQEVIFPHISDNDRFNFSVFSKAAEKVSGDYYDIFDLGDSSYGFLLVDVQGHGIPAAMVTMIIKEKFRLHTSSFKDPADLFIHVNNEIIDILEEVDKESAMYFTAFYMIIDKNNVIHSVDAGHIRPFLIRTELNKLSLLKSGGIPMGISKEMNELYVTYQARVKPGDKVVLFTDGIIEARNDQQSEFGMDGIIKSIKSHYRESSEDLMKSIIRDLSNFTDLSDTKDDATLFIIELK